MSCCGGNCGCGSACTCVNGCCGGCKKYPDLGSSGETTKTDQTLLFGVAPAMKYQYEASGESNVENDGCNCKCGSDCKCDPCTCT